MGGVPKQRKTKSRQANRRMHLFIKSRSSVACPKCAKPVLPHTVCKNCGYYKGKEVIDVIKKLTKKEKKQKEREMKTKEAQEKKGARGEMSWERMSKK